MKLNYAEQSSDTAAINEMLDSRRSCCLEPRTCFALPLPLRCTDSQVMLISVGERWGTKQATGIIEWLGVVGTLKLIQFQSSCQRQGHVALDEVAQSFSSLISVLTYLIFSFSFEIPMILTTICKDFSTSSY